MYYTYRHEYERWHTHIFPASTFSWNQTRLILLYHLLAKSRIFSCFIKDHSKLRKISFVTLPREAHRERKKSCWTFISLNVIGWVCWNAAYDNYLFILCNFLDKILSEPEYNVSSRQQRQAIIWPNPGTCRVGKVFHTDFSHLAHGGRRQILEVRWALWISPQFPAEFCSYAVVMGTLPKRTYSLQKALLVTF